MNSLLKYFSHYLPLFGILIFTAATFLYFSYDKGMLIGASFAVALAYASWGIVHHFIHKDLNLKIVFEYVGVSLLGLVMLLAAVFWI